MNDINKEAKQEQIYVDAVKAGLLVELDLDRAAPDIILENTHHLKVYALLELAVDLAHRGENPEIDAAFIDEAFNEVMVTYAEKMNIR
jgi:hypothetical protein